MTDFNIYDWQEVCEHIHEITPQHNIELFNKIKQIYPLNEMGFTIKKFKNYCGNVAVQIHFNIINIMCLGNNVGNDCIHHWKIELMSYINKIIYGQVDKNVKRDKIVFGEIIEPYLNIKTYQFDSTHLIISALNDEIRKSYKNNSTNSQKIAGKYIKENIIPDVDKILSKYNVYVGKLYKSLINAAIQEDLNIFVDELDNFITTINTK